MAPAVPSSSNLVIPARLKARLEAVDRPARLLELGTRAVGADPRSALGRASAAGLGFVVLDLWNPGQDPDRADVAPPEPALPPAVWLQRVVGRGAAGAGYAVAYGWARHTGLSAVILPLPDDLSDAAILALGRALAQREVPGPDVWVEVPWSAAGHEAWRRVAALVDHDPRVSPCLRIVGRPPKPEVLGAWRRAVPACLALTAAPTGKALQAALTEVMRGRTRRIYLDGVSVDAAQAELETLFAEAWTGVPHDNQRAVDHTDGLIDPVQPLRDHIGAAVYQNFELVAPKYEAYRRAVARALQAALRPARRGRPAPVSVAVLGAGRGPLVDATLAASAAAGVPVAVTAVEKNPHAAMTLRQRVEGWGGAVTVVESDMRDLPRDGRFQVVVSELLGGFGDNELSPECLDGVEGLLTKDGVSLPRQSTSYVAPVECSFLWSAARKKAPTLDVPYGVHPDRAEVLAPYQPCFTFHHPAPQADLRRQVSLRFVAARAGVVHGFLGTFDAALDDQEVFGNHPEAPISVALGWAPLFFPLRQPVRLARGEVVEVAFFRERDARRVWYAWAAMAPVQGALQNASGVGAFLTY
jgi:protein arginine N-methyltransferase 5